MLRAIAEHAELAAALATLAAADGYALAGCDPLAPLAHDIAGSLIEAGCTLHHCVQTDPLYRLGGVCVLPIPPDYGHVRGGVAVSWTTHDLLALDGDRYGTYQDAHQVMNAALVSVLHALGFAVKPFGSGGAWLVTGHRARQEGGGR